MCRPQDNLNLTPILKIAYFWPQKPKRKYPEIRLVDLKHILDHNPAPKKAQILPLFNVKLSQPQLNSMSTQFQLNFDST